MIELINSELMGTLKRTLTREQGAPVYTQEQEIYRKNEMQRHLFKPKNARTAKAVRPRFYKAAKTMLSSIEYFGTTDAEAGFLKILRSLDGPSQPANLSEVVYVTGTELINEHSVNPDVYARLLLNEPRSPLRAICINDSRADTFFVMSNYGQYVLSVLDGFVLQYGSPKPVAVE